MTDSKPQGSDADRALRRRILRMGAVGAPVVLTFRGTSAWAVSAGCLVKEGMHPIPGQIIRVDENFQPIPKAGLAGMSESGMSEPGVCGNNGYQYGNDGKNKDKGNAGCNNDYGNSGNTGNNSGLAWYEQYETVFVTQDPFGAAKDRVVDRTTDIDGLRALVYNGNIGMTCLASIQNMAV